MDGKNRRRFERYDAFIQLNLLIPISLDKKALEVTGWIKNVSQSGIALEIYFFNSDEVELLSDKVTSNQRITTSILLPDDLPVDAECKIIWGEFIENKRLYAMGLEILAINPLQKDKWDSFIEKLAK